VAPSPTALAKLAVGPADPVTQFLNYAEFSPGVRTGLLDLNATRGTFDRDGNRVVVAREPVTPRFSSQPTAAEAAVLAEWGMGGTPTGAGTVTYPLGDNPVQKFVFFNPKAGETWFLSGVACDVLTVSAAVGEGLRFDLDLVGKTWDDTRADFPAGVVLDQTTRPWVLSSLVLTVGGVVRKTRGFTFQVNHHIDRERFLNSVSLTDIVKLDQEVTLSIDVPSGDNPGLWKLGVSTLALLAVFTNAGGGVLNMSIPDVRFEPNSPEHPLRGEGFLRLSGQCYRVGAGRPVTLTVTPGA
jgi:hypothetical protein